jgi:hypothetical protein
VEALVESFVAGVGCGVGERRNKNYRGEREKVMVAALPLVRSWVDGDDGGQVGGDGGDRC